MFEYHALAAMAFITQIDHDQSVRPNFHQGFGATKQIWEPSVLSKMFQSEELSKYCGGLERLVDLPQVS